MTQANAWSDRPAPSLDDIGELASAAFEALPEKFRKMAGDVVIHIYDFPDEEVLEELGIEDPFELTGLYSGHPVSAESSFVSGEMLPIIHLFRRPLLDEWVETGVSLESLITHVIVHEVGHHFGLSDADMHALESEGE